MSDNIAIKVEQYLTLRDYKAAAKKELDEELKPCNEAMAKLESEILTGLAETGSESSKTKMGTAYKRIELTATVEDPEAFMEDVRDGELWDALDVKANKTEIRRLLDKDLPLPRGLKVSQTIRIGIRSPAK